MSNFELARLDNIHISSLVMLRINQLFSDVLLFDIRVNNFFYLPFGPVTQEGQLPEELDALFNMFLLDFLKEPLVIVSPDHS